VLQTDDEINPVKELLDALSEAGINRKTLAARLNLKHNSVSMWMDRGCISPRYYIRLSAIAAEKGIPLNRSLFNWVEKV
jgi:hypothetical protein